MKTLTRHLFLLSVVILGITFFLLNPQVCFSAPCVGWEAATCMARKAYAEHDPKYCSVANHPWRDCLIGLAVLEGKPEDCMKLTEVEGTCIGSLAAKRLDPKICDYLQDTVAVDYKTQCVVDVYHRLAVAKNDPAYCDHAVQAAAGHLHVYNLGSVENCRAFLKTTIFPTIYGSDAPMSCDCNEKESNIPVPPPVVYETAGDSSSNHSLCDRTLSRIADLIAANKLPPSDKEVLNYVDPYEQQAYGYFENISKKSAIERENWANFYRHSTFQSRTPNPAKSKSAAYVYKATLIVPQSKTPLPMDINMVTIDGRCMIEM